MEDISTQNQDSFSTWERKFLPRVRRWFLLALTPLVRLLALYRISPNVISALQIPGALVFFYLIDKHAKLAFLAFLAALLIDALDGSLARFTHKSSRFGAFFDQFCDHSRETIVVVALASSGALSAVAAIFYVFVYPAFNLVLFLCNYYRVPLPLVVKSYLVFYPAIFLYLWLGINWLDLTVALSTGLMVMALAFGFRNLYRAMD